MAKINIEIKGLKELQKQLKKNADPADIKFIVRQNGSELQRRMQRKADFRGHWGYKDGKRTFLPPTGALKDSIGLEIKDGGMTAEVGPEKEYGEYLEFGTRFMDAQPFVQPALDEQKDIFISDLKKIMR
jgi:HK97 gp10 family phage protein